MKACPSCYRLFPDDGGFCPIDGSKLASTADLSAPSDPEDKRVGRAVCQGRYRIYRRVADGGTGRVYQALDTREQRGVAVKILHPEVAMDEISVERFKREYQLSKSLPHNHIVEVFSFEATEDESFALVMEYLEGEELRMLLKREKVLPPERVIRILSQVALGVQAAHDRKVVHRDLKPDNVFLCHTRDGDNVKLLDFGSVRDNSEGAKKLTVMGTTIGSPFYMSPEQAQGLQSLDHRADVWSVAAIAYEALTGRVPFEGSTGPAILLAILSQEPKPPSELGGSHAVPPTLDAVMENGLMKNAELRIATIGALVDGIGAAYGLVGHHAAWATTPQDQLAHEIKDGLPRALAEHQKMAAAGASLKDMDAAFKDEKAFNDDIVMGVPESRPKWIIPTIAVVILALGAVIALLALR
ncbi:MAG: serine/threonine protein kinase [Polyangiaceae bacterium]|nr:serine/threonine protein kinase [Polyangiaceae bacterium]